MGIKKLHLLFGLSIFAILLFFIFINIKPISPKIEINEEETEISRGIIIIDPSDLSIEIVEVTQLLEDDIVFEKYLSSMRNQKASNLRLKMYLETQDKQSTSLSLLSTDTGNFSDFSPLLEFVNLEELRIRNHLLTDISGIKILSELEYLNYLLLDAEKVSNIGALSALVNLKTLVIEVADICTDASVLLSLENLEKLYFLQASSESIKYIAQLSRLKELGIRFSPLSNEFDITSLQNLTNLQKLYIWSPVNPPSIYPELDISMLSHLKNLEHIELEGFTIKDIEPLLNLPNLSMVNVMFSKIDESNVMLLKNRTNALIFTEEDNDH